MKKKQFKKIKEWYVQGLSLRDMADLYHSSFGKKISTTNLNKSFYREMDKLGQNANEFKLLAKEARTRKNLQAKSSDANKLTNCVIKAQLYREDLLDEIIPAIKTIKKATMPKEIKSKNKLKMTMEALLSDLHIGLRTKGSSSILSQRKFNTEIAKKRVSKYADAVIGELRRESETYDVETLIIACLGDIIQNSLLKKADGIYMTEYSTAKQISNSVLILSELFFFPVLMVCAELDISVKIIGVPGNHDRESEDRVFSEVGNRSFARTIYEVIELVLKSAGFKNVTYRFSDEFALIEKVYNEVVMYEHGDRLPHPMSKAFQSSLSMRKHQFGHEVTGTRSGHYHEAIMIGKGTTIMSGCLCGAEPYGTSLGYYSDASQTIVSYVNRGGKKPSFYRVFVVDL